MHPHQIVRRGGEGNIHSDARRAAEAGLALEPDGRRSPHPFAATLALGVARVTLGALIHGAAGRRSSSP